MPYQHWKRRTTQIIESCRKQILTRPLSIHGVRDRSKFTGYLAWVLGKFAWKSLRPPNNFLKKVFASLFLVEKNSSPPIFFEKIIFVPLFHFSQKEPKDPKSWKRLTYLLYASYANERTRVTWPNIDKIFDFQKWLLRPLSMVPAPGTQWLLTRPLWEWRSKVSLPLTLF